MITIIEPPVVEDLAIRMEFSFRKSIKNIPISNLMKRTKKKSFNELKAYKKSLEIKLKNNKKFKIKALSKLVPTPDKKLILNCSIYAAKKFNVWIKIYGKLLTKLIVIETVLEYRLKNNIKTFKQLNKYIGEK